MGYETCRVATQAAVALLLMLLFGPMWPTKLGRRLTLTDLCH